MILLIFLSHIFANNACPVMFEQNQFVEMRRSANSLEQVVEHVQAARLAPGTQNIRLFHPYRGLNSIEKTFLSLYLFQVFAETGIKIDVVVSHRTSPNAAANNAWILRMNSLSESVSTSIRFYSYQYFIPRGIDRFSERPENGAIINDSNLISDKPAKAIQMEELARLYRVVANHLGLQKNQEIPNISLKEFERILEP